MKICKNCRFVVPHVGGEMGFCHFWPVQANGANGGVWPPVRIKDGPWIAGDPPEPVLDGGGNNVMLWAHDSWCASFKPKRRWWQIWRGAAA